VQGKHPKAGSNCSIKEAAEGEERRKTSGSGDLEIIAPGVGLAVAVEEDEAFDG